MGKISKPAVFLLIFSILSVLLAGCTSQPEETFRNAKVISVSGTATLLRGETSMELYEGLVLQGGDQLTTGSDGRADLKLDEDKYVVLEANTNVILELEGDPQKGAIRLHQTSGTIHHTIENPLSQEDSYEVYTPDAVMAVRGTDFTTIVTGTGQGTQTCTQVQSGSVEMTPNNPEEPPRNLGPGESATAGTEPGGPSHFLVYCPLCAQEVFTLEAHLLSCGEGHYSCDGNNHEKLLCGHYACEDGSHDKLPCGHYACEDGNHDTLPCDHYACDGGSHDKLPCDHYACDGGSHDTLPCSHYACEGGNHDKLSCDHYACDGGSHAKLPCGHYACDGGSHDKLPCGHYACEDGSHDKLPCGNYACAEGHRLMACGHCTCDTTYEDHSQMPCGHYACNSEDLGHEKLPCGNYDCHGGGHARCYGCGGCVCTGDHSQMPCGHLACEAGAHDVLPCGHYACEDGSHGKLSCGHYACDGGSHEALPCGNYACTEGHGLMGCGHCICDTIYEDHSQMPCGHYSCDSSTTGDHVLQSCGNYDCQGDHWPCQWCGNCTCTGDHGDNVCNVSGQPTSGGVFHEKKTTGKLRCCRHFGCAGISGRMAGLVPHNRAGLSGCCLPDTRQGRSLYQNYCH